MSSKAVNGRTGASRFWVRIPVGCALFFIRSNDSVQCPISLA